MTSNRDKKRKLETQFHGSLSSPKRCSSASARAPRSLIPFGGACPVSQFVDMELLFPSRDCILHSKIMKGEVVSQCNPACSTTNSWCCTIAAACGGEKQEWPLKTCNRVPLPDTSHLTEQITEIAAKGSDMDANDAKLYDQLCEQRDTMCNDKGGIRTAQNVALARVSTWIMEQYASPDASAAVKADLKNVPKRKAAHLAHLARKHSL